MRTRTGRIVLALFLSLGMLSAPARAFDPYFGFYAGPFQYIIALFYFSGQAALLQGQWDAKATVVQTGGSYDAKIKTEAKKGPEKVEIIIDLNADGTGTCAINGKLVAGKPKARGPKPGAIFKFNSKATGTWKLVEGVKTEMVFTGKTNGVKTTIGVVMNLNAQGALLLDVKMKYSKNKVLRNTSFKLIAARK